jgi:hypothetical protein
LTIVAHANGFGTIITATPTTIVQVEHPTRSVPNRFEEGQGQPGQAKQGVEKGPSPDFVVHVQSVKFKLQADIVPKAEWEGESEGFMGQFGRG